MRHALVLALVLGALPAGADEIILRSGGRLAGEVRERRPDAVVIETGPGLVTVPMTQVERVVTTSPSALSGYRARAARLGTDDAEGWFELALWARDHGLNTQSRQALDHVLAINPSHSGARQAAGHIFQDGRWMTSDESHRARGFLPFEGSWVTPAEREAIQAERAADSEERRQRAESEARVREAEARARTAEAEARRAEADAASTETGGGIPYPFAFGGGTVIVSDPLPPLSPHPPVIIVNPPPRRPDPPRDGRRSPRTQSTTRALGATANANERRER